jgi:hypothetical protein
VQGLLPHGSFPRNTTPLQIVTPPFYFDLITKQNIYFISKKNSQRLACHWFPLSETNFFISAYITFFILKKKFNFFKMKNTPQQFEM